MNKNNHKHNHPDPHTVWHIQLSRLAHGEAIVTPTNAAHQPACEPFPLPPMLLSNSIWLTSPTEAMWVRYSRCMAAWLILDCRQRCWAPPIIPRQRCGADGVSWRLKSQDLAELPSHFCVGGSFQSRVASGLDEASSCVPPLDGLHFVLGIMPQDRTLYTFGRADGICQCIEPTGVVIDDWQTALNVHSDRMELL